MLCLRAAAFALLFCPVLVAGQTTFRPASPSGPTKVGPPKGTIIVVGGGAMGPEIYARFIEAEGGPNALIIDVPNAGGAESYGQDGPGTRGWKTAGATNVQVLFTKDRKVADSDSFVAVIKKANQRDESLLVNLLRLFYPPPIPIFMRPRTHKFY